MMVFIKKMKSCFLSQCHLYLWRTQIEMTLCILKTKTCPAFHCGCGLAPHSFNTEECCWGSADATQPVKRQQLSHVAAVKERRLKYYHCWTETANSYSVLNIITYITNQTRALLLKVRGISH